MTKDARKKASMSQVLSDIKPYVTKKFMSSPWIHENDIQVICQLLLPRYKNVTLQQGLTNGKPETIASGLDGGTLKMKKMYGGWTK